MTDRPEEARDQKPLLPPVSSISRLIIVCYIVAAIACACAFGHSYFGSSPVATFASFAVAAVAFAAVMILQYIGRRP